MGGQSSFTICRLNLNFKILGELLVCDSWGGGSIIFDHVQAKSELKNIRVRSWSVIPGGSFIFDHCVGLSFCCKVLIPI